MHLGFMEIIQDLLKADCGGYCLGEFNNKPTTFCTKENSETFHHQTGTVIKEST